MVRIFLIQGFRLFDSFIDRVFTFEFDKVDNIEIEPAQV